MENIVVVIYKHGVLSVVSEMCQTFTALSSMKRAHSETFKNFYSGYVEHVFKFNSDYTSSKMLEVLTAFVLLAKSAVDNIQRASVLAAVSNGTSLQSPAITDMYLAAVSYEKVASVLRQCDQMKSDASSSLKIHSITVHSGKTQNGFPNNKLNSSGHSLTSAELSNKSKCHQCQNFGH